MMQKPQDDSAPSASAKSTLSLARKLRHDSEPSQENEAAELQAIEAGDTIELPSGPPLPAPRLAPEGVVVTDYKPRRIHRTEDLVAALISLLLIAVVLGLSLQAAAVNEGVTEEVRSLFGDHFRNLLLIPLRFAAGVFLFVSPIAIIISLARRGRFDSVGEVAATGVVAGGLVLALRLSLPHLPEVFNSLLTGPDGAGFVSGPDIGLAALIAGITVAGADASLKVVRYSWYGVWFLLALEVLQGNGTLTTLMLTFLFGRLIGRLGRWVFGYDDRRASPAELVEAVLDVGLVPTRVNRSEKVARSGPLMTWIITEQDDPEELSYGDVNRRLIATLQGDEGTAEDPAVLNPDGQSVDADRRYQLVTADGKVLDLDVLDPERGFTTTATGLWERFRLAGVARWTAPTVKASAERIVLTSDTAIAAGVRSAKPVALSEAGGSVAIVWEPLPQARPLLDLAEEARPEEEPPAPTPSFDEIRASIREENEGNAEPSGTSDSESPGDQEVVLSSTIPELGQDVFSDELLDQAWTQLLAAHNKGVSHRNLDRSRLLVDDKQQVWIVGWEDGDVGSSILNREIDCAQLLVYLAVSVGPRRAVESAKRHLPPAKLAATAMATQAAIVPPGLKKAGANAALLKDLRTELAQTAHAKEEELEPYKLERFSFKAVLISVIVVVVLVAVLGSLNLDAIGSALRDANPWWIVAAFAIGLTPWVGSAMSLQAFSSVRLPLWDAILAQVAASFVGVAAPAGIGPAGVNLRLLTKHGMTMPMAIATVTLLQVYHFLTTILLLLLVVVISGASLTALSFNPMTVVWIVAGVIALVAALIAVPQVRKWLWKMIQPVWVQVAPELARVLARPKEMIYAFVGILIVNVGYIGAFGFSLAAFGQKLNVGSLSVTYLLSNTAGSVVPTPGGIGPVEAALTAGLTVVGISAAIALSASVVFRLMTFYLQMPIGWAALKWMQRKDLI